MRNKLVCATISLFAGALAVTGCASDADVVSKNLSKESDQFKINRRVVFFNGITDKYLLSIEGKCSIKDENNQLEVTCKTGDDEYKKHFLGLSDNVSYFVEQLDAANVSAYHYKVIFKPETIIADVDRN
ncbi:beta-sandwich lipoprotein [Nocardia sp. SSK8]|uniref:beta-sandwich lipoprotein n=1 Tax=Nocardia sp. SSK8 TaxID=3120154 RepID=UPI00300A99C3